MQNILQTPSVFFHKFADFALFGHFRNIAQGFKVAQKAFLFMLHKNNAFFLEKKICKIEKKSAETA